MIGLASNRQWSETCCHIIHWFRSALLHDFDPQRDVNPSPRSWVEGVSDTIGIVPSEAEYETFKGAVGEGCAAEFTGFLRLRGSCLTLTQSFNDQWM